MSRQDIRRSPTQNPRSRTHVDDLYTPPGQITTEAVIREFIGAGMIKNLCLTVRSVALPNNVKKFMYVNCVAKGTNTAYVQVTVQAEESLTKQFKDEFIENCDYRFDNVQMGNTRANNLPYFYFTAETIVTPIDIECVPTPPESDSGSTNELSNAASQEVESSGTAKPPTLASIPPPIMPIPMAFNTFFLPTDNTNNKEAQLLKDIRYIPANRGCQVIVIAYLVEQPQLQQNEFILYVRNGPKPVVTVHVTSYGAAIKFLPPGTLLQFKGIVNQYDELVCKEDDICKK